MRTRMIALALLVSAAVTGGIAASNRPDTYVYKRGNGMYSRISGSAINRIGEIYKKYGNEFVWLRMNGRSYVIRDAATLAEVRNAFRHLEEMDPSLRDVERRMKPFEQELEKIEERVDSLGDSLDDERLSDAKRDAIEAKLRDAEEKMRGVEEKMRLVEREMEKLEKQAEKLEKVAEARFDVIVQRAVEQGVAERVE
jgi:chromosome segregation ATPase